MSYNPNISSEYYSLPQDTTNIKSSNHSKNNSNPIYNSNYIGAYNQNPQYTPSNIPANMPANMPVNMPGNNMAQNTQYMTNTNPYSLNNNQFAQNNQFAYNPHVPLNNMIYDGGNIKQNNYELFSDNTKITQYNWINFGKKIVIYTILFLIMSHVKMNNFVCSFIPFLNNNEVLCMIAKGFIMSILIIIIQKLV